MPRSRLLPLAAPLVVSFWLRAAFAWVDTIFAATLRGPDGTPIGDESIAAIGLTLPFEFLLIALWVGTSNGLTARLAAAMGARQGDRVEQLKRASVRIIWALSAIFMVLAAGIWMFADRVGLEPVLARQFRIYATVLVAGSAVTSFWSVLPDSLIKAHHDTRTTMWAGLLSSVTNVVFNVVFVFVFGWGIFGIALSTVVGRLAGLWFATAKARRHEVARRALPEVEAPALFRRPARRILQLAIPSAITYVLMALESLAVNGLLANAENATSLLAGWSIFDRALRFLAMPLIATSVAMLPLTARLSGEDDCTSIRRELGVGLRAGTLYVAVLVLPLALLAGPPVASMLTDAEAAGLFARQSMVWLPLGVFALLPFLMSRSTWDGLQLPRPGLVASAVRAALGVVPMTWAGLHFHGALGVSQMQGACAGFVLGTLAAGVLFAWWTWGQLRRLDQGCPAPSLDEG